MKSSSKNSILNLNKSTWFAIAGGILLILFLVLVNRESSGNSPISKTLEKLNLNLPQKPLSNKIPFKKEGVKDPYILAHQYGLLDVDSGTLMVGKGQDTPVAIA